MGVWWGRGSTVWLSCTGSCGSWQWPRSTWSPSQRDPRPRDARSCVWAWGRMLLLLRSSGEERQESRAQDGPVHFPSHSPSHSSTYVAHVHQLPGSNSPLHPIPPAPGPPSRQTKARSSALARMGSPARLLRLPAAAFDSSCTSRQAVKRREFEFKQSEFKTALNSDCLNSNSHL